MPTNREETKIVQFCVCSTIFLPVRKKLAMSVEGRTRKNQATLKKFMTSSKTDKKQAEELVRRLKVDAEDVKEKIEEEMMERFGFKWPIYMGFHAIQSME